NSSLLFSRTFYEALASDRSVQRAFDCACESLQAKGLEGSDAMVLQVQNGMSAEVPFLSSMGFFKEGVVAPDTDSILGELSSRFEAKTNSLSSLTHWIWSSELTINNWRRRLVRSWA